MELSDMFTEENAVYNITEEDYKKAEILVDAAKAFARTTHRKVYVIDYYKKEYIYISDDLKYWCGSILKNEFHLCFRNLPEHDQCMMKELNKKLFEYFYELPVEERHEYCIYYGFNVINNNKHHLISRHLTPLALTRDGRIWLALCTMSSVASRTPSHIVLRKTGSKTFFEYSLNTHDWVLKQDPDLTDLEYNVLVLSSQGYTMADISDKLCRSVDSLKSCKKQLFSKMNVNNITEAVSYATNYRLI